MRFVNKYVDKIYKYIYIHDDETILIKDIARAVGFTEKTVIKYIRWLVRREYIKKDGKHFKIIPD